MAEIGRPVPTHEISRLRVAESGTVHACAVVSDSIATAMAAMATVILKALKHRGVAILSIGHREAGFGTDE